MNTSQQNNESRDKDIRAFVAHVQSRVAQCEPDWEGTKRFILRISEEYAFIRLQDLRQPGRFLKQISGTPPVIFGTKGFKKSLVDDKVPSRHYTAFVFVGFWLPYFLSVLVLWAWEILGFVRYRFRWSQGDVRLGYVGIRHGRAVRWAGPNVLPGLIAQDLAEEPELLDDRMTNNTQYRLSNVHSPNRRSLLFMPGDSRRKIEKATQLDVDCVIMDLEDGAALNRKVAARQIIVEALEEFDFGARERLIRINGIDTSFAQEDVLATVHARPNGYVIPKVESPDDLVLIEKWLTTAEQEHGWPNRSIRMLAIIETAKGIMNLREIAQATPRLDALMFGAEDLAGDIGAVRTAASWEVFYARSAVVTAAAAYGLQSLDTVFVDLTDLNALEKECIFVRQMGYTGKMAIHPRQVDVINRIFTPSQTEIEKAEQLIQAFDANQADGTGAFELDGKMVDMPMVRAARRMLARAGHQ